MISISGLLPVLALLQAQTEDKTKWKIAEDGGGTFLFPPEASTVAEQLDSDYYMIQNWSIFFTVLIFAVMFGFIWKYNRRVHPKAERTPTHNTGLELLWSVPPGFVLVYMFWRGFVGYLDLRDPPVNSNQIAVEAKKWDWTFTYPNGAIAQNELHLVVNEPTTLTMTSVDVLHSLYIPAFRTKMDVVPGRYTKEWFIPTKTGRFTLECTEYCGTQHSDMLAKVFVHTREDFDQWVFEQANWLKDWLKPVAEGGKGKTPEECGERIFSNFCTSCHRSDDVQHIGPVLKGKFGKTETFSDGTTAVVDEAYIKQSLEEPSLKIVKGFEKVSQMPTFKGTLQPEYQAVLIAYIKSLK